MTKFLNISTDTSLGGLSPSDEIVSSQKALKTYIDNHSGGGSVAIDNSTITKNSSDEIQAVATVNANTAAGATNPVYDWVGTLAEYTSQAVATNHPDWVCYITDDAEATAYQAYTQSQCNNLFVQKGHEVIDFQEPNAGNNYTWYRKYADGWVEQGGLVSNNTAVKTISLVIEMADVNYQIQCTSTYDTSDATLYQPHVDSRTTTSFKSASYGERGGATNNNGNPVFWLVYGMAA